MNAAPHPVTLSQIGFALVVLEGQIAEEMRSIRRWARQEEDARENRIKAQAVLDAHLSRIKQIKRGL